MSFKTRNTCKETHRVKRSRPPRLIARPVVLDQTAPDVLLVHVPPQVKEICKERARGREQMLLLAMGCPFNLAKLCLEVERAIQRVRRLLAHSGLRSKIRHAEWRDYNTVSLWAEGLYLQKSLFEGIDDGQLYREEV